MGNAARASSQPERQTVPPEYGPPIPHKRSQSPPEEPTVVVVTSEKTTDTPLRYLAYIGRGVSLVLRPANLRYLAYTSDVGEAVRLVVSPWVVRSAYLVSWTYVGGDVVYEAYKEKERGKDKTGITRTVISRAIFQSIASMALPAFTIHTVVHYSKPIFVNIGRFMKWGPAFLGFSVIPFLPLIYDHPVEYCVEKIFDKAWPDKYKEKEVGRVDE